MITSKKSEYENLTHGSQKRISAECDGCKLQYTIMYRNYLKSQQKRNSDGKTFCKKCSVIKSNQNRDYNGKNFYISSDGYKMIRNGKSKQKGIGWSCYSKEHKLVVEKHVGRKLKKSEVIHHIDGNKLNNRIENLYLCKTGREHRVAHTSLGEIGLDLYNKGLLYFDSDKGIYVANVKFRELLGHPEEDNQQPSLSSNTLEGSETRSES